MVHVFDLLGCFARDKTTESALEITPDAIRSYLALLRRHGEDVPEPSQAFQVRVAEHITQGQFLGMGSPTIIFAPDREPLTAEELERYLRWLDWVTEELLGLVSQLSEDELAAPYPGGRSIKEILQHVWQAEQWYVKNLGGLEKVKKTANVLEKLGLVRAAIRHRFQNLTQEERSKVFLAPGPFGPAEDNAWTARKSLRRCLEHQWEHLNEVASRLEIDDSYT